MLYKPTQEYDAFICVLCEIKTVKMDSVSQLAPLLNIRKRDDDGVITRAQGDFECQECRHDDVCLFI